MKKINWNDVRLVLMLGAVIFLFAFSSKRNESRMLKKVDVIFSDNEAFITRDKVNKLLIQNYGSVTGIRKDKLDLNNVEKTLDADPMIDKAEVFTTIDGRLEAVVKQRQPVARIYRGADSYYIDSKGQAMPLSDNYTARVPIVTGEIDSVDKDKLRGLLCYINNDGFLKKNIIGVEVYATGGMRMKSRGYDYDILFGRPINIEKKFNNYKAFLQEAVRDTLIEQYKTINLKFTQQVVCTKK
ncbi:cell division protein FtsQ [Flavobacterium sp. MFBS3-15]|uniref:cell division protein FtsQ/DivIB n=1 Tax=Flavobacterium sp. MFBS3-15 TaxID=2989816 RepID=UPI002235D66C|nr:cell division protein FtsQ [Flavobacterium sp. MFBS3-15]MCW4469393.1 cell division protein FtsQ [Flavobacterium sp. MFBS3-15]